MFKFIGALVVYGFALYGLLEALKQCDALIKPDPSRSSSGL